VQSRLEVAEEKEKDAFLQLSAAMRNSYEKERARVERTKNWSIIGSVVGTILGMWLVLRCSLWYLLKLLSTAANLTPLVTFTEISVRWQTFTTRLWLPAEIWCFQACSGVRFEKVFSVFVASGQDFWKFFCHVYRLSLQSDCFVHFRIDWFYIVRMQCRTVATGVFGGSAYPNFVLPRNFLSI